MCAADSPSTSFSISELNCPASEIALYAQVWTRNIMENPDNEKVRPSGLGVVYPKQATLNISIRKGWESSSTSLFILLWNQSYLRRPCRSNQSSCVPTHCVHVPLTTVYDSPFLSNGSPWWARAAAYTSYVLRPLPGAKPRVCIL